MTSHRRGWRVGVVLTALAVVLASCTSSPERDRPSITAPSPGQSGPTSNTSPGTTSSSCPVTVPGPVPQRYPWRGRLFGWHRALGNGSLWVGGLGEHGVIGVERSSGLVDGRGRVSWKLGWWRVLAGNVVIAGRRLDGVGRLVSEAGTVEEYGPKGFVASGVTFSRPGCWRITGRVGAAALTFVTLVRIRR